MNFNIEDYKGKYVMHCKTEEEAKVFCAYLDSLGRIWYTGDSYLSTSYWHTYKESMCYNFNAGTYCDKEYYKKENYTILEIEDFMEENKNMNYADFIFKILNVKPNEPFILRSNGKKSLIKISPDLKSYRPINEFTCFDEEVDEWVDYGFGDVRNILLGKAKIEKLISEENKKIIDYWKRAGFHYLAKDKDEEVYAFFYKPIKDEKRGSWDVGKEFKNDDPLKWANIYRKCDFLSWEDDEPYCLD